MIRFPVNCHSTDSLFSWLSLWFLMKHLDIPSIDFPSHSERTHHCTWVSHSPHLQPFPAIQPFWNTIEFPVYLNLVDWSQGELKPASPISSWEKQWKHMGKKQWPTWKHMEKHIVFRDIRLSLDSNPLIFSRVPPHLGLGRLVGPDCGVLVGLGDFFGTPLRNPHDPIKNKDSTRKNGDIMGYNQQTWGARPAVTVSYGNPLIIGESSPHVST